MAPVVTMKQLLEAGVHFGHQTRRWNPKMKRFIYGDRSGIYIIDLQQTLARIEVAYGYVRDLVADGGTVLFVGTKKQAQDSVQSYAEKCGMPYVNQRWLGGMLTNFETMSKRVAKMKDYQRMEVSGELEAMPKKEALLISRELVKLERNLGGIRNMEALPDAVFILDTKMEHIAVTEANKLGLPIVAVVDTNCDPDIIQYVIPGNDDAIRSGTLMCRIIADAVDEGRFIASRRSGDGAGPGPRSEEDEARVAAEQAEARRQAAVAAQQREARLAGRPAPIPPPPPRDEAPAPTTAEAASPAADVPAPEAPSPADAAPAAPVAPAPADEQPDADAQPGPSPDAATARAEEAAQDPPASDRAETAQGEPAGDAAETERSSSTDDSPPGGRPAADGVPNGGAEGGAAEAAQDNTEADPNG